MVPYKNLKMRNIFSQTNISKDNKNYKFLGGYLENDLRYVIKNFWLFEFILYEYEIDDDVLVIDVFKSKNPIKPGQDNQNYYNDESVNLLIHPDVNIKYVSMKPRWSILTFYKSVKNVKLIYKYKISTKK
jgi:hypothetical protein